MSRIVILDKLYNRVIELARHKYASAWLAFISFIESTIFPIPPDVMFVPMCISNRKKIWFYATICTVFSVIGGAVGYFLGAIFYDTIGFAILNMYSMHGKFTEFQQYYKEFGVLIVLAAGITPFPYKVITIASGVIGLNFFLFMISSLIARAFRFFLEAILLWYFGEKIRIFIEKHLGILTAIFVFLIIGGFILIKYI